MNEANPNSIWPIYVISLPKEQERRANCVATMKSLGLSFSFFDAIDGSALKNSDIAGFYDPEKNQRLFKRPMSPPEIGCYMSHHALWTRIGAGEAPGAVVIEDDFDADDGLPGLLREISRLDLGNRLVKLHSERSVAGRSMVDLAGGYRLIDTYSVPGQTLGYVISRETAASLTEKVLPFGRPVDMDLKHWWELDIAILMVQPPVLHSPQSQPRSAIESSRQAVKPGGDTGLALRLVRNLRYQLPYRLGLFKARWKSRAKARKIESRKH
jgi:glycosyl transferase family 25